jgi:hypothetical protein
MTHSQRTIIFLTLLLLTFFAAPVFAESQHKDNTASMAVISGLDNLKSKISPATINISVEGRDYTLKLWSSRVTANQPQLQTRYFQGIVEGDAKSWVRLSLNNTGLSGHMKAFNELFKLKQSFNSQSRSLKLIPVNPSQLLREAGIDKTLIAPSVSTPSTRLSEPKQHSNALENSVTQTLRLSIVVDSRFNEYYNGKGLEEAIGVINDVDGLFQEQFGLAIKLETTQLLSANTDPFRNMDGSLEHILFEFRHYTLNNPKLSKGLGLVHLFSGAYDDKNIIGLSWINTLCRKDGYNVSISTPFSKQMLLAAHELGHNLGASHDDQNSCADDQNNIMWPKISRQTNGQFSSCSKKAIKPHVNASCNLDNIDLGTSIELTAVNEKIQKKTIRLSIKNNDNNRNAKQVTSNLTLPDSIIPDSIPKECSYFANTISCNHGPISSNSSDSIYIDLDISAAKEHIIYSALETEGFTDVTHYNNNASIDLLTAAVSHNLDENNTASSGSGAGAGMLDKLSLLFSLSIMVLRRKKQA